ncbi:MucBP domain-containing protein [Enterococcus sp. DIV1283b]|uniref:MucBP domain-containing protein n=1 Tax=Enterococcus sp. DIV1283b TaxID=2774745 RepID=UPI003F236770
MKKKIFGVLSLAILLNSLVLMPLIEVWAEEQKETVEQYNNEDLKSIEKTTDSLSDPSNSIDSSENNKESTNGTSERTLEVSDSSDFEERIQPNATASSEVDASNSVRIAEEDLSSWLPDPILQSVVANSLGISVSEITKEKISHLETLYIYSSDANIADLTGLEYATNLSSFFMSGTNQITDFTVINEFPKLESLAAYGQNVGRKDEPTSILAKDLTYDQENQSFFVPFSLMPNRLTNFDGYQPPFTTSNSTSQTYFDLNGVQVPSSRLAITEDGITVSGVTQSEFESIETMEYNARFNNPAGSYAQPDGYSFYAISSGTYLHQFLINHQEAAADIIVSYIDTEGNELKPSQNISGNIGESFDATTPEYKLEIDGYTLKEVQGDATGTFSEDTQEVVYVYERSDAAPVTVRYQDSQGNQLSEPKILSGKIGLPYESEAKEITGWYVIETPSNASGIFSEEAQEVTYVYERSDAAPVTVRYQDSRGNQLSEPKILSGKIGLPYESEAKEITGWYVIETPSNASGFFSEEVQEVVYTYASQLENEEKNNLETDVKEKNDENVSENNYQDKENKQSGETTDRENSSDGKLPNTGEEKSSQRVMIGIGLLFVLFTLVVIGERKKSKRE